MSADSIEKIADEMVNWTWTADRTPTVVMRDWAKRQEVER